VCLLNFHLSFVRFLLHLARGGRRESYHYVSGFPLVGSLFVLLGAGIVGLPQYSRGLTAGFAVVALLDTGGIHWFLATMIYSGTRRLLRDRD
jgi:hypothetical protein